MSASAAQHDPGIQVVAGDVDPEVDGRGLQQGQRVDRDALPEDQEAYFQANFQPDEPADHNATANDRRQPDPLVETASTQVPRSWLSVRWSSRWQGSHKKVWLRIALFVTLVLAITCATLAGVYERRSHAASSKTGGPREPTSNCKDLKSPYDSINGSQYNLVCGIDYPIELDIVSVWVYQFVDCIHACSSFNAKHRVKPGNESCTGISYGYGLAYGRSYGDLDLLYLGGNCFLKGEYPIPPLTDPIYSTDSAFLSNLGLPATTTG